MKLQLLRLKRTKNCAFSNKRHFGYYPPVLIMKEVEKKRKEKGNVLVDMILRW